MMYNSQLNALIAVAEQGSFSRAAKSLYISPTAVMKQMSALEEHLGLQLFDRTSHGVQLTPGGEVICREAKKMIEFSRQAVLEAQQAMEKWEKTFCVGTSLLNPAKPFMDIWAQVGGAFPGYKLHLVPFEDDLNGIEGVIAGLGVRFDFIVGVCDSKIRMNQCRFLELGRYRKMVAIPQSHPLAAKESLILRDLDGQTMMMVPEGDSGPPDRIRAFLRENCPGLRLEDTQRFYDVSVFNRAAETGKLLLTIECWKDVHPALKTVPAEWDFTIPYGLMYALDAPEDVKAYVEVVRGQVEAGGNP